MVDLAARDGLELDAAKLSADLGVPVIETVAVRKRGIEPLLAQLDTILLTPREARGGGEPTHDAFTLQRRARDIALAAIVRENPTEAYHRLDGYLTPGADVHLAAILRSSRLC